jgi:Skp family chaperone for outer membrane proteins
VQDAIVQVAKRSGYRFVLDSKKEAGLSLIVLAPEENDLTLAVIEELGLKDRK